jgi:hypothetical protein
MMEDTNYWWIGAETLPEDGTYMFRYNNGSPNLDLEAFKVVRETPKGKWVENPYSTKHRFIRNNGRKRFAHETREAALESFKRRKICQIRILKTQLRTAEESFLIAGGDPESLQVSPFPKYSDDWYY